MSLKTTPTISDVLASYRTGPQSDPLLGFSPDEIVVGPGGQTLTQAADPVAQALVILGRPQHPEHVAAARVLLDATSSLDDLWHAYAASGHVPEVWAIAALAWHIRRAIDDADERAGHERAIENYRASDADRMARGLDPLRPYVWGETPQSDRNEPADG